VLIDYALGKAELGGDVINDATSRKHFEQWDLLGDPTLKIGGYEPDTGALEGADTEGIAAYTEGDYVPTIIELQEGMQPLGEDDYPVTTNPAMDTSPETLVADDKGNFLVGYTYETPFNGDIHPGFAWSSGGALWTEFLYANPVDSGHSSIYTWEDKDGKQHTVGTLCFGPRSFGGITIPDITDPYTWGTPRWQWTNTDVFSGRYGCAVTGYVDQSGSVIWGGVWTGSIGEGNGVHGMFDNGNPAPLLSGGPSNYGHFASDCDQSKNIHYYVCDNSLYNNVYVIRALPPGGWSNIAWQNSSKPDVLSEDGDTYVVHEYEDGSIHCKRTATGSGNWKDAVVTEEGFSPRIVFDENGQLTCYYVRDGKVYKSTSGDGASWTEVGQAGTASDIDVNIESPLEAITELMVFDKGDDDIYANVFADTKGVVIDDFELDDSGRFIRTAITNGGTAYLMNATWELEITGISPLGEFFGQAPGSLLYNLLKGRVFSGGYASDSVWMGTLETEELMSPPTFGLGHVEITVRVTEDGEVLAEKTEDGSLLGRRILLRFPEE
jgi:hypothetical protein